MAAEYARLLPDMTTEAPLDRAVLGAFVELVDQTESGLVAEIGCGTGRVMSHLVNAGLHMVGVDVSLGMASVARSSHPRVPLAVADAYALPLRSGVLAGLIAWYSIINLPPEQLPGVFTEFARVMRPDAPLILAFQAGAGERIDKMAAYGLPVPMTYYRHQIERVSECLLAAGLPIHATVRREQALEHESSPQALLVARRM